MTSPASFACPDCNATSTVPEDVKEQYCGRCHEFKGDCPGCGHANPHPVLEGCTHKDYMTDNYTCGCTARAEII